MHGKIHARMILARDLKLHSGDLGGNDIRRAEKSTDGKAADEAARAADDHACRDRMNNIRQRATEIVNREWI